HGDHAHLALGEPGERPGRGDEGVADFHDAPRPTGVNWSAHPIASAMRSSCHRSRVVARIVSVHTRLLSRSCCSSAPAVRRDAPRPVAAVRLVFTMYSFWPSRPAACWWAAGAGCGASEAAAARSPLLL